ncbi:secretin N-terminal domain-containing protein [Novosphingobium sp. ZN18A2]|uniref:type II secretion system protein GspD n=1 Tax=Novosphingobium sp. ZN18A2 TaxID=3079861 RepID=UPI0030D622F4
MTLPRTKAAALWRLLAFLAAVFAGVSAGAVPAAAQPGAAPAVLTEVMLVSETPDESVFRLTFQPRANGFGVIATEPGKAALGLALATRGNSAVSPPGLKGLVHQIRFDQVETVLILHFDTASAATLKAKSVGPATIEVTVSTGARKETHQEAAAREGPLPQASAPPPGEDGYELVFLKYADVSEVVGLLADGLTVKSNDVFNPSEPAFGSSSLTGNSYAPTPQQQGGGMDDHPLGESVNSAIAIDRRLNAVWLKGSAEEIARLKQQIAMIDVPVDSVILETQLVELTESGAKAVGIDFNNTSGQIGVASIETGKNILPGYYPNAQGRLNSASLQAAIYAQVQRGQGKIVSRPRIAAQSGSTAKIVTGDALPILTSITLSGVNGVSQQVQYVNVGVTLQIAPRVSDDGMVSSHVFCVVSSVTGYSQGYPTISQREAETSATVRDGESFVIGGLTQEDVIQSRSKIPLLGDIPLIGSAFRVDRKTRSKTELYIVVTPHVVRRVKPRAAAEAARALAPGDAATPQPAAAIDAAPAPPLSGPQQR